MEELKLERSKRKIQVYGKTYDVTSPTVKQVLDFQKSMVDVGEGNEIDALCTVLSSLGIPKDVVGGMELDHITKLSEFFFGSKKN